MGARGGHTRHKTVWGDCVALSSPQGPVLWGWRWGALGRGREYLEPRSAELLCLIEGGVWGALRAPLLQACVKPLPGPPGHHFYKLGLHCTEGRVDWPVWSPQHP